MEIFLQEVLLMSEVDLSSWVGNYYIIIMKKDFHFEEDKQYYKFGRKKICSGFVN